MVSRLAVAGRWHVLMHSAGTGITPRQSIRLTFAMLFASNFLPTTIGGDVVRYAGAVRLGFDSCNQPGIAGGGPPGGDDRDGNGTPIWHPCIPTISHHRYHEQLPGDPMGAPVGN